MKGGVYRMLTDETPTPQRGGAPSPAGNHEECRLGNT